MRLPWYSSVDISWMNTIHVLGPHANLRQIAKFQTRTWEHSLTILGQMIADGMIRFQPADDLYVITEIGLRCRSYGNQSIWPEDLSAEERLTTSGSATTQRAVAQRAANQRAAQRVGDRRTKAYRTFNRPPKPMDPRYLEAHKMYHLGGKKLREIAEHFAISLPSASKWVKRAEGIKV